MRARSLHAGIFGATVLVAGRGALADDAPRFRADPTATLRYTDFTPPKNALRTTLEEIGILALGMAQYTQTTGNSTDWDLDYTWDSFEQKLDGRAISLDTNRFDTNWVTHPFAGFMYYVAARGNRFSIGESFLFAVAASTIWEYLGEFREQASINDLIVTPATGLVFGEAVTQLGQYFAHGPPNAGNQILAWLFGTSNQIHDALDGVTPSRIPEDRGWHEFRLSLGGAYTRQSAFDHSYLDGTIGIESQLVHAPHYRSRGEFEGWLSDGNVSHLSFRTTVSEEQLVDARFDATVDFAGYYAHHARSSIYVGTGSSFRYAYHDYDRSRGGSQDRTAEIDLPGLTLDGSFEHGPLRVHVALTTSPAFASPTALAAPDFRAENDPKRLGPVANEQGYYFAGGAILAPQVEVQLGPIGARANLRLSAFRGIEGFQREAVNAQVTLSDEETLFDAQLFGRIGPVEIAATAARRVRNSRSDDLTRHYSESSYGLDASLVF
ncbi:hypothetical protein BH09MYX1_BH09MYX1_03360 [soil metagenome]